MPRLHPYHFLILIILVQASSCTSLNITNYYRKNQSALDSIEAGYRKAYLKKPFSIEFTDRPFNRLSLELVTDTLTYIYEYTVGEPRLQDTLLRYGYDTAAINSLITDMRSMECTWIDNLDYYTEERKHSLIYISLWPRVFTSPFANKKYYILTYFQQPQYFDSDGRLLVGRRLRRVRRINAEVFHRINDKVAYTVSDRFR
ncbi:MAG TPA: hypothetical protein VN824_02960 [Puia sp.]|nr:hypothetical protein [Puia sp.]